MEDGPEEGLGNVIAEGGGSPLCSVPMVEETLTGSEDSDRLCVGGENRADFAE